MDFRVVKKITKPLMKMEENRQYFLRIDSNSYEADFQLQKGETGNPPTIMDVMDYETGEECRILVHTALLGDLTKSYPNGDFVGRSFSIVRHPMGSKKYVTYSIDEVAAIEDGDSVEDVPEAEPEADKASAKAKAKRK